jgi:hypothetical protein
MFPYALSCFYEGANKDTIGVTRGISAKLPHCISLAVAYPMENEMSLVHHAIKWWGCNYIIENDKNLNERTCNHPMLKPMSKLMHVGGGKRRY